MKPRKIGLKPFRKSGMRNISLAVPLIYYWRKNEKSLNDPRLQNSPYFLRIQVREPEQSDKRSGTRLKTESETGDQRLERRKRLRTRRVRLAISLLVFRKKPDCFAVYNDPSLLLVPFNFRNSLKSFFGNQPESCCNTNSTIFQALRGSQSEVFLTGGLELDALRNQPKAKEKASFWHWNWADYTSYTK